jgi:signal transduction histidine kinase/ligand-binding sensor domain-containing protein
MKNFFTLVLWLVSPVFCPAQTSLPSELHFYHLAVKDGLPEGFVQSMIQDQQGYIWMTTQRGLVRYDGYQPKVYTLGITHPSRMGVYSVYQDHKGRIWAGTFFEGLYLYDRGKDCFIHYLMNSTVSGSKSSFAFLGIKDDNRGRLWLNISNLANQKSRFILFDPATGKFTGYGKRETGKNHINADKLNNEYQDSKGHIWISSSNGIYEFNNKNESFTGHLATADANHQKEFSDITEDALQPGVLWFTNARSVAFNGQIEVSNNKGLWRFNMANDSAKAFYHNPQDAGSIASDTIFKVLNDSKGRLWIGTKSGVSLFDRDKNNFINYYSSKNKSESNNSVFDILEDKSGNFWCQAGKGILYFNTKTRKFTRITADPKETDGLLSNVDNHALMLDKSGTLWFGISDNGVQWINLQKSGVIQYDDNPGALHNFPGGEVMGFAKSVDGTIWIGAQHGLYRWQPQSDSFTQTKFWTGKPVNEFASSPMVDHNGKVWFYGSNNSDDGLDCYNPRTRITQYYRYKKNDSTSLSSNVVSGVYEDHLENIWIGTRGDGICRMDQKTQKFVRYPYIQNNGYIIPNHGALDDDEVNSIFEDKSGTLWVGTNKGGLNRFNREAGTFISSLNVLPGLECVLSIYQDNGNRLWVGTYFGGFFEFNVKTGRPERFTEKNGLLYDGANTILEDSSHNLWLTSSRGISIFNPQTRLVRTLTTANALPVSNLRSAIKISNREFLFNSDNGFFVADPEDFAPDRNPPVVHIESVGFIVPGSKPTKDSTIFVFNKKDIRLSYNENRLTFNYVGLNYQEASLVKYSYKLEGYDKDWINAGSQRTVTYTNLSPGTYTFTVKAANSGGVWTTKNPSIVITILSPWWKTWWAYSLYALLIFTLIWSYIHYRSKALRRENILLEEKINQRTKQLQQSLTDLKSAQSQLIQSEKMASLGELTAGIAHEIQNPLNFVNNFSDVNKELIEEMNAERIKPKAERDEQLENEILNDLKENEEKINHHGKRADAIVKGMLQHSRQSSGQKEATDINKLADEYLRLSYHGLRAKDKTFNADFKSDFDESIGKINIIPQDIGRVLLNLFNNAFYAANEQKTLNPESCNPTIFVSTKKFENKIQITVKDNGNGIPQKIIDKIFQPFFTTKPTGEGTGLGLSLSYDIIKAHGGEIKVESKEGEGSEFIISLPVKSYV